jgi:carbon storage regulator CsrA
VLVLSRKARQELQIGKDIAIVVKEIKGNRVVLGIVAPAETTIKRGELREPKEEPQ